MLGTICAYIGAFTRWLFLFRKKSFKEVLHHEKYDNDPVNIMSSELVNMIVGLIVLASFIFALRWFLVDFLDL
jgi:hypothetical protein